MGAHITIGKKRLEELKTGLMARLPAIEKEIEKNKPMRIARSLKKIMNSKELNILEPTSVDGGCSIVIQKLITGSRPKRYENLEPVLVKQVADSNPVCYDIEFPFLYAEAAGEPPKLVTLRAAFSTPSAIVSYREPQAPAVETPQVGSTEASAFMTEVDGLVVSFAKASEELERARTELEVIYKAASFEKMKDKKFVASLTKAHNAFKQKAKALLMLREQVDKKNKHMPTKLSISDRNLAARKLTGDMSVSSNGADYIVNVAQTVDSIKGIAGSFSVGVKEKLAISSKKIASIIREAAKIVRKFDKSLQSVATSLSSDPKDITDDQIEHLNTIKSFSHVDAEKYLKRVQKAIAALREHKRTHPRESEFEIKNRIGQLEHFEKKLKSMITWHSKNEAQVIHKIAAIEEYKAEKLKTATVESLIADAHAKHRQFQQNFNEISNRKEFVRGPLVTDAAVEHYEGLVADYEKLNGTVMEMRSARDELQKQLEANPEGGINSKITGQITVIDRLVKMYDEKVKSVKAQLGDLKHKAIAQNAKVHSSNESAERESASSRIESSRIESREKLKRAREEANRERAKAAEAEAKAAEAEAKAKKADVDADEGPASLGGGDDDSPAAPASPGDDEGPASPGGDDNPAAPAPPPAALGDGVPLSAVATPAADPIVHSYSAFTRHIKKYVESVTKTASAEMEPRLWDDVRRNIYEEIKSLKDAAADRTNPKEKISKIVNDREVDKIDVGDASVDYYKNLEMNYIDTDGGKITLEYKGNTTTIEHKDKKMTTASTSTKPEDFELLSIVRAQAKATAVTGIKEFDVDGSDDAPTLLMLMKLAKDSGLKAVLSDSCKNAVDAYMKSNGLDPKVEGNEGALDALVDSMTGRGDDSMEASLESVRKKANSGGLVVESGAGAQRLVTRHGTVEEQKESKGPRGRRLE